MLSCKMIRIFQGSSPIQWLQKIAGFTAFVGVTVNAARLSCYLRQSSLQPPDNKY